MSLTRCPHCRVVLTEEEQQAIRCPACAGELWEDVPTSALEPAAGRGGRGRWFRFLLLAGGSLALLLLAGGMGWYGWTSWPNNHPVGQSGTNPEAPPTVDTNARNAPAGKPAQGVATTQPRLHWQRTAGKAGPEQRAHVEAHQANPPEVPVIEDTPPRSITVAREFAPRVNPVLFPRVPVNNGRIDNPPPNNRPGIQPPRRENPLQRIVFRPVEIKRIDNPNGEFRVQSLNRDQKLKLVGRVKTLKVGLIDQHSILDARQLEAKEIIFLDRIDSGSTVLLRAPNGRVLFKARVDGRSQVEVDAPNGSVLFAEPTTPRGPGSKIDGGSQVKITARTVTLRGVINGAGTVVDVTINSGGQLQFLEMDGQTALRYHKANPREPVPVRVVWGTVRGGAQVQSMD
jgi:hypothetical protein